MIFNGRIVVIRNVRNEFVRICGLNKNECERIRARLHRVYSGRAARMTMNKNSCPIIIERCHSGWLEIEILGIHKFPNEKREVAVNELQETTIAELSRMMPKFTEKGAVQGEIISAV